jgi:hypothetical protein
MVVKSDTDTLPARPFFAMAKFLTVVNVRKPEIAAYMDGSAVIAQRVVSVQHAYGPAGADPYRSRSLSEL